MAAIGGDMVFTPNNILYPAQAEAPPPHEQGKQSFTPTAYFGMAFNSLLLE